MKHSTSRPWGDFGVFYRSFAMNFFHLCQKEKEIKKHSTSYSGLTLREFSSFSKRCRKRYSKNVHVYPSLLSDNIPKPRQWTVVSSFLHLLGSNSDSLSGSRGSHFREAQSLSASRHSRPWLLPLLHSADLGCTVTSSAGYLNRYFCNIFINQASLQVCKRTVKHAAKSLVFFFNLPPT
jgi:hypothetical protein